MYRSNFGEKSLFFNLRKMKTFTP